MFLPLLLPLFQSAEIEVQLAPAADSTIYEPFFAEVSNSLGQHVFCGQTAGGSLRRGLLRFDIAQAVPAGSRVVGAQLRLALTKAADGAPRPATLHRVTTGWDEGPSDASAVSVGEGGGALAGPGDPSWSFAVFPGTAWSAVGGDFAGTPSAQTLVGGSGAVAFGPAPELTADVQAWLDEPNSNFGWILVGDEGPDSTARRFGSRENVDPADRPVLLVRFEPCGSGPAAEELVRLGTPPNPEALLPGQTAPPILGATWDPRVDHTSFATDSVLDLLGLSALPANVPSPFGTLLCDLSQPPLLFTATPGQPFSIRIPRNPALSGANLCTQAVSIDGAGTVAATNALDVRIGLCAGR